MKNTLFNLAQEAISLEAEAATGQRQKELEYVLYAKLTDHRFLETAAHHEAHEQWEVKIPKTEDRQAEGRIRIRQTTEGEQHTYVLTIKTPLPDASGLKKALEVANPSSADAFEQFKLFATSGMVKDRYVFPIEGSDLTWEVDVHRLEDGTRSEWVRIELECETALETLPALPDVFTDVIRNQGPEQTEAEKQQIQQLYDTVFLRKAVKTETT